MKLQLAVLAALTFGTLVANADSITVQLNQSEQNYTLNGAGGSNGYATYLAEPGACTAGASITTCVLTGTYTGSTPGYTSGTYTLTTSFANTDGGLHATSTEPVNSPSGGNYFTTDTPTADVNVTLTLDDITGLKNLPLIIDGVDLGNSLLISATHSTCTGLSDGTPCTQANVGLSTTASIYSPVTGQVIYELPVAHAPEPAWLALGGMLPGAWLAVRRRLRKS